MDLSFRIFLDKLMFDLYEPIYLLDVFLDIMITLQYYIKH